MREYETYEDMIQDRELDLRYVWTCNACGHTYEDYPGVNEALPCSCGGQHVCAGETYNG